MLDDTHDPATRSWVESADGHPEFPIQNLPIGRFSVAGGTPRHGIAIGAHILDCEAAGLPVTLDAPGRQQLRQAAHALLCHGATPQPGLLHAAASCTMHLPCTIGDYSDFYAGIHHATNTGTMLRPDQPLSENYKYVPIAYHGRASSVRPSGTPVHRPSGQRRRGRDAEPSYGPSRNLDFELELGIWIGRGSALGATVPITAAAAHVGGYCLLNDWSARDIQGWEYQPLGPFLAKSFCTTISPWIVTPEALAPFRLPQAPRPPGDPAPLPYLFDPDDQAEGALDITLDALIQTAAMQRDGRPAQLLSRSNARHLYWTVAQMVTQQASNGCNLCPGDLLGSGTISGPDADSLGSLLEITRGGRAPLALPGGETRRFLEDGDTLILRAAARRDGFAQIGFGECRGTVIAAPG